MKLKKSWAAAAAAAAAMAALSGAAQAALVSLGDGTVKDTNTNLIWLQNWNVNGFADWGTQKAWAEGLDFAGSTSWELPKMSEYAALLSAYGNLTAVTQFTNVQPRFYWSGMEDPLDPDFALVFGSRNGGQGSAEKSFWLNAVAVRPADVAASVPEPQTLALALLALGATVVVRTRRSR